MSDLPATPSLDVTVHGVTTNSPLGPVCRIGRSESNDIVLDDHLASRNHAVLYCSENGEYFINDLGSSNATFLNGRRITAPVVLREGDVIAIAACKLVFRQPAPVKQRADNSDLRSTSILITRTLISVLVADIRGFTTMAQRVDADTLSQITGALFREAGLMLQHRSAWTQKYIGDAVMAVWQHNGKPQPKDIFEILGAASAINRIAGSLQTRFGLVEAVRMGVAVNTGWASVSNLGSIGLSDYTAVGDTVNKAFRLESATKDVGCDVLIGLGTHEVIAGISSLTDVFEPHVLRLKGYSEPVHAFGTQHLQLETALNATQASTINLSAGNE